MIRTLIVDAHVLLWFLEDSLKLSEPVASALADPDARVVIRAIALAEAYWAIRKKKTMVTADELSQAIAGDARITIAPLDREVVARADKISADLEMHDCLIIATTLRTLQLDAQTVLLSDDQQIRRSNLVPVVF